MDIYVSVASLPADISSGNDSSAVPEETEGMCH